MKITGVSRKVDELGRIVLPIELRRNLCIKTGDLLDISINGDKIVLIKQETIKSCVICSQKHVEYSVNEKYICGFCKKNLTKI